MPNAEFSARDCYERTNPCRERCPQRSDREAAKPSPWGEGAPKGRMWGLKVTEQLCTSQWVQQERFLPIEVKNLFGTLRAAFPTDAFAETFSS